MEYSERKDYFKQYYLKNKKKIAQSSNSYYWKNRKEVLAKIKAKKEQAKLQPVTI